MHRLFRNAARIGALTAVIVGGGTVATIPSAMADIGADIGLVCSGTSGTHKVRLRIETTAPSSGTVGQPVQLGTVKIDVGVPAELASKVRAGSPGGPSASPVTSVTPSSTAPPALSGVAEIQVAVRAPDRVQDSGWPAFALAAAPSYGDGIVHLTGSGVAPPVTPDSAGGLSWSAGGLDLSLVPAETSASKDGAETALHCTAEKETLLGTVRIARGNEAAGPSSLSTPASQPAASQTQMCELLPARGTDPRYAINYEDPVLKKLYDSPAVPKTVRDPILGDGLPFCIKGAGFLNAKKVGYAVPVAVESSTRFQTENRFGNLVTGPNLDEKRGYGITRTNPTPATILGFGFMPTRAVAEAVQSGPPGKPNDPITANLRLVRKQFQQFRQPGIGTAQLGASSYVRIKAVKAEVNGVPIDLGEQCTTSPTAFVGKAWLGGDRTGYLDYKEGQTLVVDDLDIPSFSGCGVTEDLSPILTASVSGSGNYANVNTGTWCDLRTGAQCVNNAAPLPATVTVPQGGDTNVTGHQFLLTRNSGTPEKAQFGCESMAMRFDLKRGHWLPRYMLAKGNLSLEGCKVKTSDGIEYPVVESTQEGPLWLSVREYETRMTMQVTGLMLNVGVDVDDDGAADCSVQINHPQAQSGINQRLSGMPGSFLGEYDNGTLNLLSHDLEVAPESTCSLSGFTRTNPAMRLPLVGGVGTNFAFTPKQQIIWDRP